MDINIIALIGICVLAAFLSVILKRQLPEYSMVITIAAGVIILGLLMGPIQDIVSRITALLDKTGLPAEYPGLLFKAVGICIITQLASDVCRDAGEGALAEKAELSGKVFLLFIALPLFENIATLAVSLMGG